MRKLRIVVFCLLAAPSLDAVAVEPPPWSGYKIPPLEVTDQTGKVVGQFVAFDRHTTAGGVIAILLRIGDHMVPMQVMRDRLLATSSLLYTSADCSGTAYVADPDTPGLEAIPNMMGIAYPLGADGVLYRSKASATPTDRSIQSYWRQSPPFMGPPGGPPGCDAWLGGNTKVVEVEQLLDLGAVFSPPFSVQ